MTSLPSLSSVDPSRLVTLSDGRPGLRGGIHVEIREPGRDDFHVVRDQNTQLSTPQPSTAVLEFIASDETLDRYDEIVMASGWKLESYKRNPVFQNAHKYGDIIFTLGKALLTEVRDGRLLQQVEFAVDVNPMAKIAYGLYRGKFLNAVSVGFIPLAWENGPSEPSTLNSPTLNQQFRRKYTSQELLEVSAVGIPANPNALALGLKAGAIEKSDIKDTLDLLRQTLGESESRGQRPEVKDPAALNHQLIYQLTRDLHAILRRS